MKYAEIDKCEIQRENVTFENLGRYVANGIRESYRKGETAFLIYDTVSAKKQSNVSLIIHRHRFEI